jgi:hypothetical protein
VQQIQQALIRCLRDIRDHQRSTLLIFLTHNDVAFLRAFDLPPEAYDRIAQSIIDICTRWEWL